MLDAESRIGVEAMQGFDASRRKSTEDHFKQKRGRSVSESEPDPESNNETSYMPNSAQMRTIDEDQHRPNMRLYKSEDALNLSRRNLRVVLPLYASTENMDSNVSNIQEE